MATTETAPINGTYAPQGYEAVANNYAAAGANSATGYSTSQQPAGSQPGSGAAANEIPKDEVGWYFVEQYYTTLSKSPDKLYVSLQLHDRDETMADIVTAVLQQAIAIRFGH